MELILLFILSGAVSWSLGALALLALLHALGRATANSMGLPYSSKAGIHVPSSRLAFSSSALAPWPPAPEARELAPAGELLPAAREQTLG